MVLGLHDYVEKNRFPGVVLGLSGGIDSALSAAVAVDALGPERVHAVMMPSRYTSRDSLEDAAACAARLGIRLDEVPIEPAVDAFHHMLAPVFANRAPDTTEENIQSRIRGVTLMAISNKLGSMVLTTGNKSEMSVGYATLYGDMCGGYSVLKDVYKTTVFALSRWRNEVHPRGMAGPPGEVIPDRIIAKPPTAELRDNQKDEDSLPPYDVLDRILDGLVEQDLSTARAGGPGLRRRHGPPRLQPPRPRRVQAPPGPARRQDHRQGLRPRPPLPDHQRLPPGGHRGAGSAGPDPAIGVGAAGRLPLDLFQCTYIFLAIEILGQC